jgi:hypothetical protein
MQFSRLGDAAAALVPQVVDLAGRGGLVAAAGPLAELVPQLDRVADRGRDVVAVPDIQGQARAGQAGAELLAAQEAGQPAGARDQGDGLADDEPFEGLAAEPGRGGQQDLEDLGGGRVRDGRSDRVGGGRGGRGGRGGVTGVAGSGGVKGVAGVGAPGPAGSEESLGSERAAEPAGAGVPWPWRWLASWRHSRTRSSRTAGLTSPNTTGLIEASHPNASAASPSSQAAPSLPATEAAARCPAHSPRTRSIHCSCSLESASRTIRSAREMWAQTLAGCPARSGSSPALTSRCMH